jgi:pyruvate/2-oxoglutarate dehydrogenase complex dihydrolipoamide dehydrogenase (E3) component
MVTRYDSIIIGAGQGGTPLAMALAKAGETVALIERGHVGGTCINAGCTPTKTMVASARVAYLSRRRSDYGVRSGPVVLDLQRVRERKNSVVHSFREGSERRIEDTGGLTLVRGTASFESPTTLSVKMKGGGRDLVEARRIIINTGCSPAIPDIDGLPEVPFLTSTTMMELEGVPGHLIVLGGGYIGLEFGQMFRRFGSDVTIIHRGTRLLAREDADVADAVAHILREDGISIMLNSRPARISMQGDGISVSVVTPSGEQVVHGSHLLVATGRTPNTADLALANAGISTDNRGFIAVNDSLETSQQQIYAIGDVKGGPAFTHISYDDFRVLRNTFLGEGKATIADRIVPYTVFIDPQLGRVGLTEAEAKARGIDYRVATMPMSYVARAIEVNETRGFMKVLVDPKTEAILGCSVLGLEGGEIMAMMQIAMMGTMKYSQLRDATFAHPTLAESLNNLFAGF